MAKGKEGILEQREAGLKQKEITETHETRLINPTLKVLSKSRPMPELRGAARDVCCVVRRDGGLGYEGEWVNRMATRVE